MRVRSLTGRSGDEIGLGSGLDLDGSDEDEAEGRVGKDAKLVEGKTDSKGTPPVAATDGPIELM